MGILEKIKEIEEEISRTSKMKKDSGQTRVFLCRTQGSCLRSIVVPIPPFPK